MTRSVSTPLSLAVVILLLLASAGCAVVGGIFKAGFWIGVVIAVVIVAGLMMLFRRAS